MLIEVFLLIATLIGFLIVCYLIVTAAKRDFFPAIISRDSIQKHLPLVCLVRVVELLVAVVIFGGIMFIFAGSLLTLDPFRAHPGLSKAYVLTVIIAVPLLFVTAFVVLPARRQWTRGSGYFRNVLRIDSKSVSNFAFLFAAFASHDFYQLWPFRISAPPPFDHTPLLNRELLWLFVFFGLWRLVKNLLLRLLEMQRKEPPAGLSPLPANG